MASLRLLEMAAQDISKWWLAGMPIDETHNWIAYTLVSGGADITNHFCHSVLLPHRCDRIIYSFANMVF